MHEGRVTPRPTWQRASTYVVLFTFWVQLSCGPAGPASWDEGASDTGVAHAQLDRSQPLVAPTDAILPTEAFAGTAAEEVVGEGSVSPDGTAAYRLPLWVPPGRAGVQPALSMQYVGSGATGLLGIGWTISGATSEVRRCPQDSLQDLGPAPVRFTFNDALCLDGDRLLPQSADSYRTQSNGLVRVVKLGNDFDSGFEAYMPDGTIRTYTPGLRGARIRPTTTAPAITYRIDNYGNQVPVYHWKEAYGEEVTSVIYSWVVTKVRDRYGNAMEVTYKSAWDAPGVPGPNEDVRQLLPWKMSYTHASSGTPAASREVEFTYAAKASNEVDEVWVSGFRLVSDSRLTRVDMHGPNVAGAKALLRRYTLGYTASRTSGRSLLTSVSECDGAGVCKRPLVFSYGISTDSAFTEGATQLQAGLLSDVFSQATGTLQGAVRHNDFHVGDFDGDGREDLLYRVATAAGSPTPQLEWRVRLGTPSGLSSDFIVPPGLPRGTEPDPDGAHEGMVVDFDRDGRDDVIIAQKDPEFPFTSMNVLLARDNLRTAGFASVPQYDLGSTCFTQSTWIRTAGLGDLSGDGRIDVLCAPNTSETSNLCFPSDPVKLAVNNGPGAAMSHVSFANAFKGEYDPLLTLDLEGVGRESLLVAEYRREPSGTMSCYPNGNSFTYLVAQTAPNAAAVPTTLFREEFTEGQHYFVDFNADGLRDAIVAKNNDVSLLVNTGYGFRKPMTLTATGDVTGFWLVNTAARSEKVGDLNGDGREDIISFGKLLSTSTWGTIFYTRPNGWEGRELPGLEPWSGPLFTESTLIDVDGDGTKEYLVFQTGQAKLFRSNRNGKPTDTLTQVRRGFGAAEDFSYKPLVGGSHPDGAAVYRAQRGGDGPECVRGTSLAQQCGEGLNRFVVAEHSKKSHLTDAAATTLTTRYTYADWRVDGRNGGGPLGFGLVESLDVGTQVKRRVYFDNFTTAPTDMSNVDGTTKTVDRFIYAGLPLQEVTEVTLPESARTRTSTTTTTYANAVNSRAWNAPFLTYAKTQVQEDKEDAVVLSRTDTTVSGIDTFGNVTAQTKVVAGVVTETLSAQYTNDTSLWLLGKKTYEEVTSTLPAAVQVATGTGGALESVLSEKRSVRYTYDTAKGTLRTEEKEPQLAGAASAVASGGTDVYLKTTYTYTGHGMPETVVMEGSGQTRTSSVVYDAEGLFPVRRTNAAGHLERSAYHPGFGVPVVEEDANGQTTTRRYDGFGRERQVDSSVHLGTRTTSYSLTPDGHMRYLVHSAVTAPVQAGGTTPVKRPAMRTLDGWGRPVREEETRSNGASTRTVERFSAYDANGRLQRQTDWGEVAQRGTTAHVDFTYDRLGRLLEKRRSTGLRVRHEYAGRYTTSWDASGLKSYVETDALGRPSRTANVEWGTNREVATTYTYGPFGVQLRVRGPDGVNNDAVYDALGRILRANGPNSGLTQYGHTAFGELAYSKDSVGTVVRVTRDTLGRVTRQEVQVGTSPVEVSTTTWDTAAASNTDAGMSSAPRALGLPATSTSPDGVTTAVTYDAKARPRRSTWTVGTETFALGHNYDDYGRPASLVYLAEGSTDSAHTRATVYTYNTNGDLWRVQGQALNTPTVTYWEAMAASADGVVTHEWYGSGATAEARFDVDKRLRFLETTTSTGTSLQRLAYDYLPNGNLKARHDVLARTTEDFEYDFLSRLTHWKVTPRNSKDCAPLQTNYTYSDGGNLTSVTSPEGSFTNEYALSAAPHALSTVLKAGAVSASYTYDARGRQVQETMAGVTAPTRKVTYTAFDLPRLVTGGSTDVAYRYDAANTRTVKEVRQPGTSTVLARTVYVGGLYEKRTVPHDGSTTHVFYVQAAGKTVAQVERTVKAGTSGFSEGTRYLHTDHLGSTETVTDATGGQAVRFKYDPFGRRVYPHALATPMAAGQGVVKLGFTGHEHDDEYSLINMKGRIYDARLRRFLSVDPRVSDPLQGQTYNGYAYVRNNPLGRIDPSGFEDKDIGSRKRTFLHPEWNPRNRMMLRQVFSNRGLDMPLGGDLFLTGGNVFAYRSAASGGPASTSDASHSAGMSMARRIEFARDRLDSYQYAKMAHQSGYSPPEKRMPEDAFAELAPITLNGMGDTYLDDAFIPMVQAFVAEAQARGVTLRFNSAYRTPGGQAALRNDPNAITPATLSLHSTGFAVDVNYSSLRDIPGGLTGDQQRQAIRDAAGVAGLGWGGTFREIDPPHFFFDPGGDRLTRIRTAFREWQVLTGNGGR
jgi:RHS repeat-associated protein